MGAAPEKHCRLAPSSASRWSLCPYSITLDLPEQEAGKAAAEGTLVHGLCADILNYGGGLPEDVTPKQAAAVTMYVDHVRENQADEILVEHFWESPSILEFGGTADVTLFVQDACAVYDFKYGRWPVVADSNPQLLSYASIVAEHRPDIKEFYGVIIQPNSSDKVPIKPVAQYTLEQINEHRDLVAWASTSDHKQTGSQCRFCPVRAAAKCPEGAAYCAEKGWR